MAISVDVQKKLGEFALNVKFESASKRIGILGASGCGKSMTLKSIAGIETPTEGKIQIGEHVLFDSKNKVNLKPQKRKIGYLFQNYALFPTMTVAQNIAAGLKGSKQEKENRVREMAEKFQIQELLKRLPGQLSGGQQQRVALARIMAYSPDVILLDEPFSALDVFLKDYLQQELEELLKDYEGTVIMVSHSRDEVYRFCEELLILDQGSVITAGKTKVIFSNPQYRAAAKLTGCKNFAELQYTESPNKIILPDWGVTLQLKKEVPKGCTCIGYRAHDFVPVWGEKQENCIEVRLKSMSELPFENQYYLNPVNPKTPSICWFVQREKENVVETNGLPEHLQIVEERLMFLK